MDDLPEWCDPELFDEIAGILEFDAHLERDKAEFMALIIMSDKLFNIKDVKLN